MKKRFVAMLACMFAVSLLLPTTALAQDFTPTPNAHVDADGVLHWDAEGEYYSRIDLSPLLFGPDADSYESPVNEEYTYDIENLFQMAEQFYGSFSDIDNLSGRHPVTFVYYEQQPDGTMKEVGRAEDAYSYTYTTGQLAKLTTPGSLSWTGGGFIASWSAVTNAARYEVIFYETTAAGTNKVGSTTVTGTSCELTSVKTAPVDGATYAFEVRAWGPEGDYSYIASDTSAKSAESNAWVSPVVAYGLTVGGIDVTSANAADVLGDVDEGATVTYDAATTTLALNGAHITGMDGSGRCIYAEPEIVHLTIVLEGSNSCGYIDTGYGNPDEEYGSVTIKGPGSLAIAQDEQRTENNFSNIRARQDLVIDGATITIAATKGHGLGSNLGAITIKNGAQVAVNSAQRALDGGQGITVMGKGTSVDISTTSYFSFTAPVGDVTIKDGAYVKSTGMAWAYVGDFLISGEGTRVVASPNAYNSSRAVSSESKTLTVEQGAALESTGTVYGKMGISVTGGSTLDVDTSALPNSHAVAMSGVNGSAIAISGSTLKAKSQDAAVYGGWDVGCDSSFTVENGSVVELYSSATMALNISGDVSLTGGTITLEGAQGAISLVGGSVQGEVQGERRLTDGRADAGLDAYPDAGDATAYAVEALEWATENDVLMGFGSGELAPTGQLNRAMLAAMLMRLDA